MPPSSDRDARSVHELSFEPSVAAALEVMRRRGTAVGLESVRAERGRRPSSWVAGVALAEVQYRDGRWQQVAGRRPGMAEVAAGGDPFLGLQQMVGRLRQHGGELGPAGAYGFYGYETTAAPDLPRLALPDAAWILTDTVFEWTEGGARLWCPDSQLAEQLIAELESLEGLESPPRMTAARQCASPDAAVADCADRPSADYASAFSAAHQELRRGNSYQLCLTYPIRRDFRGDPLSLYASLRRENPAPFAAAFLSESFSILSSSPERFLSVDAEGRVEASPMKGTAPRTGDAAVDSVRRQQLSESAKDHAENLMIADLLRNDLGRVCELGSVKVAAAAELQEFETVFQMVSRIRGRLREGLGVADLLRSAFPPGSMTGAPKLRSVQILRRLEGEPRGPYSGVIGSWRPDGRLDTSVLIRVWIVQDGKARAGVGGGVVWDSTCESEWEESRVKARPLLRALARSVHR